MGTEAIPKTEVASEAPSDIEQQIIRQVEYYFGNFNLSRDKFLQEQLGLDDGWVPLSTLIKFKRLKKLSEDFNVITGALKKSPRQLMEVSDDCEKIRRRVPVPILPQDKTERQEEYDKRSIYVKGFKKNNTLDELLEFFKEYNVEHVFMRKHLHQNNHPFRGSVFAVFETREDAEKFMEKKGIKYNGTELLKEWKVDYAKRKDEEYKMYKEEKEKKMLKRAGMVKEEKENGENIPKIDIVHGALLKLSNLDDKITREHIKDAFNPLGNLVYVDYSRGNASAVLRFDSGIASSIFEKLTEEENERKVEVGTCKAVVSLIEGDEEIEYWKNIAIARFQSRQKFKGNKNASNKGRFKKYGKYQRGKGDDNESVEHLAKKMKTEISKDAVSQESSEHSSKKIKRESSDNFSESSDHPSKRIKVEGLEDKKENCETDS